jgi:hypothetical protein
VALPFLPAKKTAAERSEAGATKNRRRPSIVASFSRTFSSMSVLINHFVPTILSRKRMALRVTAGVTRIGATPKARRQPFTVWIADSLKGLLSDWRSPYEKAQPSVR